MKRPKIHLKSVQGEAYCHVSASEHAEHGPYALPIAQRMRDVTCKRCYRKFHGLPITKPVTQPTREQQLEAAIIKASTLLEKVRVWDGSNYIWPGPPQVRHAWKELHGALTKETTHD